MISDTCNTNIFEGLETKEIQNLNFPELKNVFHIKNKDPVDDEGSPEGRLRPCRGQAD